MARQAQGGWNSLREDQLGRRGARRPADGRARHDRDDRAFHRGRLEDARDSVQVLGYRLLRAASAADARPAQRGNPRRRAWPRRQRESRACFRSERRAPAGRRQAATQRRGRAHRLPPSRRFSGRIGRTRRAQRVSSAMKIKHVEPIAVSFPMKKPVFMAGVEIRRADNVLVRIEADSGVVGWGEAASAPTMTGETVESMMAAIGYLTPALEGRPAEDIAGALAAMAARMYANNGAKAAIEIALHDLVGRATNRPAYALIGGKQRSRMAVLGVIGSEDA